MKDKDIIQSFLEVYNRKEDELFDSSRLKAEGLFAGEKEFIKFAEADYQRDKHWAFKIKKEECAFIVVDLQEDFVNPKNPMFVPEAYRQIPRVKKTIEACRRLKVPVIYATHNIATDCAHDFYEFWPPIKAGALKEGTPEADVYHEIYPLEHERVIRAKHTYCVFAGTDLDYVLRNLKVKTVIICGTITNFCCESTARSAFFLGYHVVFGSDINSSDNPFAHEATIRTLRRGFARVMSHDQIIEALEKNDPLYDQALASKDKD